LHKDRSKCTKKFFYRLMFLNIAANGLA